MLDTHFRKYIQRIIEMGADFFIKLGRKANDITILALFLGIFSGVLVYGGYKIIALIFLWISGYLDAVDGTMARKKGSSPFGTVMDITFDRIVEISIILGLAYRYPQYDKLLLLLASTIIISMTIFLTTGTMANKKSEKSFYYQAGLAERTEGFIMFSLIILFGEQSSIWLIIFIIMILITVGQRFLEAKRILKD